MLDEGQFLKPVDWQILALLASVHPDDLWATEVSRILRRTHGSVVGPVAELVRRGFLVATDAERAKRRRRGLRQMVSISPEGRRTLFVGCRASVLIAEIEKDPPIEEALRLAVVAVVTFGTPGYCLIGLARDKKGSASHALSAEPFTGFEKRVRKRNPHMLFALDELAKLTAEAHGSWVEWEINSLERFWWHVRNRFPLAVEAYEKIRARRDPDEVLRELREQEDRHGARFGSTDSLKMEENTGDEH